MTRLRPLPAIALAVLSSIAVANAPLASAAPASTPVDGAASASLPTGHQEVYLQVAAANPLELQRLAVTTGLSPAERQRRFAAARPGSGTRDHVVGLARAAGLRVLPSSSFTVHAEGTPQQIAAFVGDRAVAERAMHAVEHGRLTSHAAVSAAAADGIPAALRGLVTTITGGNAPEHRLSPLGLTGYWQPNFTDITNRYSGVDGTPTSGTALTIATIQLSGWNNSALTTFANNYASKTGAAALPNIVGTSQYTEIAVSANPMVADAYNGDQEVALDQETILALAPHANQRVYFADNSLGGAFSDAVQRVADEAATYHIAALSISWGSCEDNWPPSALISMNSALANATAAGVTVFAASGDSGRYDCYDATSPYSTMYDAVDYPASDPNVVAVGGTTVLANGAESAWSDPLPPPGRPWGSGGGTSSQWLQPSWQAAAAPSSSYRMVPDISSNADASSGPPVYLPNGGWLSGGGTSIAAPSMAAMFTNTLAHEGRTSGLGDLHKYLYNAAPGSITDITTGGNNGAAFGATTGYDPATGLGTPRWSVLKSSYLGVPVLRAPNFSTSATATFSVASSAYTTSGGYWSGTGAAPEVTHNGACTTSVPPSLTAPTSVSGLVEGNNNVWVMAQVTDTSTHPSVTNCYVDQATVLFDNRPPVASIPLDTVKYPFVSSNVYALTVSRSDAPLTPAAATSGIQRTEYRYRSIAANAATGPTSAYTAPISLGTATVKNLLVASGYQYCYQVRAVDNAGNTGAWSADKCITVAYDDRKLSASSWGWSRLTATGWMANTRTSTVYTGRTLTFPTTRVRQIGIVASRCVTCGSVKVYVGTTLIGSINLSWPTTQHKVIFAFPRRSSTLTGSIRIVTQSSRTVAIDGLLLTGH